MRNDERLRTIYEVMAPYIVRNEHNWRDYLAFASQFHKHSFDNILLVYAQDEDRIVSSSCSTTIKVFPKSRIFLKESNNRSLSL